MKVACLFLSAVGAIRGTFIILLAVGLIALLVPTFTIFDSSGTKNSKKE